MFAWDALSSKELASLSWTGQDVDAALPMMLAEIPPGTDRFDRMERIGTWEKVIAWAQAHQCAEIARFVADSVTEPSHGMTAEQAGESARAEIGLMLTLAPGGAAWRVGDARTLVEGFPATFAALESGVITLTKARIIAEGCADVSPEIAAAVEARVLPRAPRQTHGQLRAAVSRAVQREDAAASERRRERKMRARSVVLYPERDGMATMAATLPAAEAVGVFAVLDQHARACGGADGRSMDARRADALTDLVLEGTGFCSSGGAAATASAGAASAGAASGTAASGTAAGATASGDAVPAASASADPAAAADPAASADPPAGADPASGAGPAAGNATAGATAAAGHLTDTGTATGDGDGDGDGEEADDVLPVAPAPSRLPGIAPACGTRTVTTGVSIQIRVIVPLGSLRADSDEPAELAGYGPITAAQARELAADPSSTWRRLATDPLSGGIVDYGTTRYRPPPDMAERVITRSQTCQFPGCRVPAHRCDLDHNEPFDPVSDVGRTSDANLGPKCRPHHRLKGSRGWRVQQYPDGSIEWITPTGHRYLVEPPPLTEPRVPVTIDDGPAPF